MDDRRAPSGSSPAEPWPEGLSLTLAALGGNADELWLQLRELAPALPPKAFPGAYAAWMRRMGFPDARIARHLVPIVGRFPDGSVLRAWRDQGLNPQWLPILEAERSYGQPGIAGLPDNIRQACASLMTQAKLEPAFREGFTIFWGDGPRGTLGVRNAPFSSLPEDLKLEGAFELHGNATLEAIPAGLAALRLEITQSCLRSIGDGLVCPATLVVDCPAFEALGSVGSIGRVCLKGVPAFRSLAPGPFLDLDFQDAPRLEALPNGLAVAGGLRLERCGRFRSLPRDLCLGSGKNADLKLVSDPVTGPRLEGGAHPGAALERLDILGCPLWDGVLPEGIDPGVLVVTERSLMGVTARQWREGQRSVAASEALWGVAGKRSRIW